MELYTKTSYELARHLTKKYSTSFGKSTELFEASIRPHIFAIYGLVRVADEIVDTYKGNDVPAQLDALEADTYAALKSGYSANPILHAFVTTARAYGITRTLIAPFYKSMRMDLSPATYTQKMYETYIYGSAEVIGLMCLKVFCQNDTALYAQLEPGAKALGSAYQKVNFLRDLAADYQELHRIYFPGVTYETFTERDKQAIIKDITRDFKNAKPAVQNLPAYAQKAVALSYAYYYQLLEQLKVTPVSVIMSTRVSVPTLKKLQLMAGVKIKGSV